MSISERANISLYGRGVFTTAAFCGGEPFLWDKHWRRLKANAANLGIDISEHSEQTVRDQLSKKIYESDILDGRIRLSFLDGSESDLWAGDGNGASLSILVGERRPVSETFTLTVSPFCVNTTSPLAGIKSCNYLEPLISFQEANRRGFNEAIRLNEHREITSACMANVFWLKGGRLYTPSLKTGCLPGTTREYLLENLECEEVEAPIDELNGVDAIFLTSAGLGVVPAARFESTPLRSVDHAITRLPPF